MRRFVIICFILNCFLTGSSQNRNIDSLLNLLKAHSASSDTSAPQILNILSREYRTIEEFEKAIGSANEAIKRAQTGLKGLNTKDPLFYSFNKSQARSYTLLALILKDGSNYNDALKNHFKSLKISESIGDKKSMGATCNNIGNIYSDQSNYPLALDYYNKALKLKEELKDESGKAHCYNNIGLVYSNQGNYPKALEYNFQSLKIREALDDKVGMGTSYVNIGIIFTEQSEFEKALQYYSKALKLTEITNDKITMASTYNSMGAIHYHRKDLTKAFEYFLKAQKLREVIGEKRSIAASYNNLGSLYNEIYKKDSAQSSFNFNVDGATKSISRPALLDSAIVLATKALTISEELSDDFNVMYCYATIGEAYDAKKNYRHALLHLQKAYDIAEKLKTLNEKFDISEKIYRTYKKMNNASMALVWHEKYLVNKDSIFNKESNRKQAEAEAKFEYETKEKITNLETQKKEAVFKGELEKHAAQRNGLIAGLVLMILLAVVTYRNYRNKRKANETIMRQKELVEEKSRVIAEKNKDITDSINYAKRIQDSLLKGEDHISDYLPEHFILFKPKDIVSGDFYWYTVKEDKAIIAAADCTGHGVPGALMSMLGITFMNEIINHLGITRPEGILSALRDRVKENLKQKGSEGESKDGMDMALVSIDKKNMKLEFCGANNPVWIMRHVNNELVVTELEPDKRPVGYFRGMGIPFTNKEFQLQRGDTIYLFTDGYADQFGGPKGKKFKYKQLKDLLTSMQDLSMEKQKQILNDTFENWKGSLDQVDDVCVIGIKVNQ